MPGCVQIRFYAELNDFLPALQRQVTFQDCFKQAGSIKDMIENLGVPHTEIDLILINGESVGFSYLVKGDDCISVYPVFESLDVSHVHCKPLRRTGFVLDTHLGRLAAYLRMLGLDTLYRNDYDDPSLANISVAEERILLTRDIKLLMRKQITHGYFVRNIQPLQQLLEILSRFDLFKAQKPFSRCTHCNGEIRAVDKQAIASQLLPRTSAFYNEFWQCTQCQKIYWKGSHYQRMQQFIAALSGANNMQH